MPKSKQKNNISVSMKPEMQTLLRQYAEQRGISASKVICDLIEKYIAHSSDIFPVVLKVPSAVRVDESLLRQWLEAKSEAIVKYLCTPAVKS